VVEEAAALDHDTNRTGRQRRGGGSVIIVIALIVGGAVGWAIGNHKGRPVAGFWLGFLLGVIGWIIAACMKPVPVPPAERWGPDPYGRHPERWWDGTKWSRWVRDAPGGTRSEDPVTQEVLRARHESNPTTDQPRS
jgi:MFS family permease